MSFSSYFNNNVYSSKKARQCLDRKERGAYTGCSGGGERLTDQLDLRLLLELNWKRDSRVIKNTDDSS